MKYVIIQNGCYYFRRKIPNTAKNFTFSLRTKNAKIASRVVALFLNKSASIFLMMKNEDGISIMDNLYELEILLEKYKKQALKEYSEIEKERHKQFVCTSKNGMKRDGSHPKCIKYWLKILQNTVSSMDEQYSAQEFFEQIFPRTKIDKSLYYALNDEESEMFRYKLIKTEASILTEDLYRSENHFNPKVNTSTTHNNFPTQTTNKYYEKTMEEIANDFYRIKESDTKEMYKYKEPIEIFISVVNKKYLIDITSEEMQDVVYIIKKLPPKTTKENIDLFETFKGDYTSLIDYVDENDMEPMALDTANGKLGKLVAFLDYAVESERLDKNRLNSKYIMPTKNDLQKAKEEKGATRVNFKPNELNALFNSSSWYTKKLVTYINHELDRIYIPLIGLLQGMRLNEIAQLYLNDICEEDGIKYFRIDKLNPNQKVKYYKSSRRNVPIHSKLIELGFLDYYDKLKKSGEERLFPQLFHTAKKGYGQAFSKKFNNKNFKKEWVELQRLSDPRVKVDFHSFRHTFATRLFGRVDSSVKDSLMGHQGKSESDRTYIHPEIKILKENIEKLDIADIDFLHMQEVTNNFYQKS